MVCFQWLDDDVGLYTRRSNLLCSLLVQAGRFRAIEGHEDNVFGAPCI